MATPAASPYQSYLETQVETAGPEKLLLMLYRGAILRCGQARRAMQEGEREAAHHHLLKVQRILVELLTALDLEQGGEIAQGLSGVYDYAYRRLVEANLKNRVEWVEEVENLLGTLLEGWEEALGVVASGPQKTAPPAAPAQVVALPAKGLNLQG